MTFDELKAEFITRARRFEICDVMHDMMKSTTYQELIRAGIPMLVYGWRTGVVDDALLAEFPAGILEDNGIYYDALGTITHPPAVKFPYYDSYELFIIKGDVDIAFTGVDKYKLNLLQADAAITTEDEVFLQIEAWNSSYTVNASDSSIVMTNAVVLEDYHPTETEITLDDDANMDIIARGYSSINLSILGSAFARVDIFSKTEMSTNLAEGDPQLVATNYGNSVINYSASV